MVTQTPNHDLDRDYQKGDEWDYNDEMKHIETRLVIRDTDANLSNYTPHSGAIFIATDNGNVYDGDGTNWNLATRAVNALGISTQPSAASDATRKDYVDSQAGVGYLSGYLSTAQSTVEDGAYINVFENLEVNDGPFTKDSASQVTVNEAGKYRITWSITYNQDSGGTRTCLASYPEVNATARTEFKGDCYIRNDTTGRRSSTDNEVILNLAAGDSIQIYTTLDVGNNNPHSAIAASATIEHLGT